MNEKQYEIIAQRIAEYRTEAYKARQWKMNREKELQAELDMAEDDAEYKAIVEKEILQLRKNEDARRHEALVQASTVRRLAEDLELDMKKLDAITEDMYHSMRDEKPKVVVIGSKNIF